MMMEVIKKAWVKTMIKTMCGLVFISIPATTLATPGFGGTVSENSNDTIFTPTFVQPEQAPKTSLSIPPNVNAAEHHHPFSHIPPKTQGPWGQKLGQMLQKQNPSLDPSYQPNILEQGLQTCHDLRQEYDRGTGRSLVRTADKGANIFIKAGKFLFRPFQFLHNHVLSPIVEKLFFKGASGALGVVHNQIALKPTPEQLASMSPQVRERVEQMLAQQKQSVLPFAGHITDRFSPFFTRYIGKLTNFVSEKFLTMLITQDDALKRLKIINYKQYETEVAKRIFTRFNIPESAQSCYFAGKRFYDTVAPWYKTVVTVFELVDNVTNMLALSYELTHHAQVTHYKLSPFEKVIKLIGIARHCGDTYLKITKLAKIDANTRYKQGNLSGFQRALYWFETILSWFVGGYDFFNAGKQVLEGGMMPMMPMMPPPNIRMPNGMMAQG